MPLKKVLSLYIGKLSMVVKPLLFSVKLPKFKHLLRHYLAMGMIIHSFIHSFILF